MAGTVLKIDGIEGAQILLGTVCIGLRVIFSLAPSLEYTYYYYYYHHALYNGVAFWMGSLFILSGTFSVVYLATFLNLGRVLVGSVAFTHMWSSTQILLLILHTATLAIALFCFGYGLHHLCWSWGGLEDYMAVEEAETPPAPEELGKEQNPA